MASKKEKAAASATTAEAKGDAAGAEREGQPNGQIVAVPDELSFTYTAKTYQAEDYDHESLGLSEDDLQAMYRSMLLQRRFEERAAQMYGRQKISGFLHLYIGQEAVSTGTAQALNIGLDSVITAYRDHGIGLALGMTADECMAELFGKIDGSSRGKGGSMHYFAKHLGFYGGHGIVGGHIPVGVGLAFAHKYKEDGGASVTYFGDGAVNQGSFHEAINLASLYDLPSILVIENNQYAMGTSIERASAEPEFFKQAAGYRMDTAVVNGMDVFAVYAAMKDVLTRAREESRPTLVEIRTYRYRGHSMSDPQKYRTKEELEAKKNEDPIIRLKAYLVDRGIATNDALDKVDDEVKEEVMASVEFAENSPVPPIETIYEDVYVQEDYPFLTQ